VYFSIRPVDENHPNVTDEAAEAWMRLMEKDQLGDLQDKIQDIKVRNEILLKSDFLSLSVLLLCKIIPCGL
jgi:hypothetical protein